MADQEPACSRGKKLGKLGVEETVDSEKTLKHLRHAIKVLELRICPTVLLIAVFHFYLYHGGRLGDNQSPFCGMGLL